MKRRISVGIIILLTLLTAWAGVHLLGGSGNGAQELDQSFHIGIIAPLTGPYAEWGQYFNEGIQLAAEQLSLTDDSLRLVLHVEDSKSTVTDALTAFNRLVDQYRPVAIISMDSETAKALAPVATDRGCLLLITIAGGADIFSEGQMAYRWYQHAGPIGSTLAEFAIDSGYRRMVIIHENHIQAESVRAALSSQFEMGGGAIIAVETFNPDATVARDQAAKVLAANPDVVVVSGTGGRPYISAIRSLRELGWNGPVLCDDSMNLPNVQRDLQDAAEGIVFVSSPFNPNSPETHRQEQFVQDYQAKYDRIPTDTAAYSYEFLLMVHDLLSAGNDTSTLLADALSELDGYETVFGPVSFAGDHELSLTMALRIIEMDNGEITVAPLVE